ncbi:acyl carrier protein [Brevifollis gellanilyticus]|uniref:Acyl carrier protein n=1 Tax=Brevifollis gellanilyticus TaxID=748831 RepID=A0A512M6Y7_9BACT|nr:acyl carrier protein [Brevifollis gellanilyticus]GEP42483.1 acyl carrier protein [Brevifollis gellanilyticus]
MRSDLLTRVTPVFRNNFNAPDLVLNETMTAKDVEGWDSFAHINLIMALEDTFNVRFETSELGQIGCVGDLLTLLESKGV